MPAGIPSAGPVVDDFHKGVPATSGNMTDLVQCGLAFLSGEGGAVMATGTGTRPYHACDLKSRGWQAAGPAEAGRSR